MTKRKSNPIPAETVRPAPLPAPAKPGGSPQNVIVIKDGKSTEVRK